MTDKVKIKSADAYYRIEGDATAFELSAELIEKEIATIDADPNKKTLIDQGRFGGCKNQLAWECLKSVSHFNLGVSFELRLKCLLHLENPNNPPPNDHKLSELLDLLTDEMREKVDVAYRQEKKRQPFKPTAIRPRSTEWPPNPPPYDNLKGLCTYLDTFVDVSVARYSWEKVAAGECRFYVDKVDGILTFLKRVGDLARNEAQRKGIVPRADT